MSNVITDVPEHLFVLPEEYEPPKRKAGNVNNIPDVDSLTPSQREIYNTVIEYLEGKADPSVRMIVFKGYAGTGKTYTLAQILKWYVLMMQNNIAVTAPTNKAVKVLKQTANFTHSLINFCTIHKLYGLKEKIDENTGKRTFEAEYGAENAIDDTQALALDETSMLPDELFHLMEQSNRRLTAIRDNRVKSIGPGAIDDILSRISSTGPKVYSDNLKVLMLGDPIQIPPVGKSDCIPFNSRSADDYGILTLELTEVIRQKNGNSILDIATITRQNYKSAHLPYERKTMINEHGGVAFINAKDKDILYRLCEVYFTNARFKSDSDFMKVIAWTNRTVDFMNDRIRTYVHKDNFSKLKAEKVKNFEESMGRDASADEVAELTKSVKLPRILIGEKLIANTPITEDLGYKVIGLFSTNDEFEVLSYSIVEVDVFDNYQVNIYRTKVLYEDYNTGKQETKVIDILHEDSEKNFKELVTILKNKAIKAPAHERGMNWKFYYKIAGKFADVKYNYAITAHKSQGSTYQNAIVIVADIDQNTKVEERNRIKYVAFTRPKEHLFIVE